MIGFDFLNNGGVPPRVGNAPANGIDLEIWIMFAVIVSF